MDRQKNGAVLKGAWQRCDKLVQITDDNKTLVCNLKINKTIIVIKFPYLLKRLS
jgi:hypothetical protein